MKKILMTLMLLLACASAAFASGQESDGPKDEMRKEFKEFKLKYLAQEMELSAEQQKKFFPLYNSMMEEKRKVFQEARTLEKRVQKDRNVSDADFDRAAKSISEAKIREGEIDRKYDALFSKFLSAKQIYKMKEAEESFRKKMREMRHNGMKK